MNEKGMAPEWMRQTDWTKFEVTSLTQEEVDRLEAPIKDFFLTLTKNEFLEGAVKRQMLGYPVSTVEDMYNDRQLAARRFWQDVCDPASGATLKYPGGFAIVNGERLRIQRPAPTVGQHNREIYVKELGLTECELKRLEADGVI
jgi:crotonobetainyl-CoA:carnitine CoA-transferase CaiB-like acyl-CoA transferase